MDKEKLLKLILSITVLNLLIPQIKTETTNEYTINDTKATVTLNLPSETPECYYNITDIKYTITCIPRNNNIYVK